MFYCNLFLCLRGSAANAYSFRHEEVFVPPRRNFCSITGYILFHHGGTDKYWQCSFLESVLVLYQLSSSNIKYIDNQLVTVIKIQMICKCKYKTI